MRANLISVIVGGLLVAGGYFLGAAATLRTSDAGVAFDPVRRGEVATFGAESDGLTIWNRDLDADKVTAATRYSLKLIGNQPCIVRTVYFPQGQ